MKKIWGTRAAEKSARCHNLARRQSPPLPKRVPGDKPAERRNSLDWLTPLDDEQGKALKAGWGFVE